MLERAARFAPAGAGLVLQPNAVKALRIGGIAEPILGRGEPMARLAICDASGRSLSVVTASALVERFGAHVYGFHRATLHAALLDLIPPESIRMDAAVRSCGEASPGVFVELETGERIEGSGLVGADGLHSAIRLRTLNDGAPRYAGYTSWRGVTTLDDPERSGRMSESWGRGARFGMVAIDGGRLYWFATANVLAGGRDPERRAKEDLIQRFSGWHDPIRSVIESTPDDAILRTDIADRDPARSWTAGRITLLGDAAHPMTPNLGQGGCQAIEDAVVLDLCLSAAPDCASAFLHYESRRRPRADRVVREARRLGRLGQIESPAARALRDLAVRATPLWATANSLRWLYDFDV